MKTNAVWKGIYAVGLVTLLVPLLMRVRGGNLEPPSKILPFFLQTFPLPSTLSSLVSIATILLALFFFSTVLKKLRVEDVKRNIILALILFSPSTLYLAAAFSVHSIALMVIFLSLILLLSQKRSLVVGGYAVALVLLFDPLASLGASALYLAVAFLSRVRYTLLGIAVLFALRSLVSFPLPSFTTPTPFFSALISDFGAPLGVSVVFALFACFGLFSFLRKGWQFVGVFISLVFLVSTAYVQDMHLLAYAVPLLAIPAADLLVLIFAKPWDIEYVKKLSLLLVFCTILFSAVSFAKVLAQAPPTNDDSAVVRELASYAPGIVLSLPNNAYLIQGYGKHEPFYAYAAQLNESDSVITGRPSSYTARAFFAEHNISYVYYSSDMLTDREEYSLHTVLDNYQEFRPLIKRGRAELWRVGHSQD